jgi:transposase
VAAELGVHEHTVGKWRRRFLKDRRDGLLDEARPRRPRTINDDQVAALIERTLRTIPVDARHWSIRSMAAETGFSHTTIRRMWAAFGLQPTVARHSSCRAIRCSSTRYAISSAQRAAIERFAAAESLTIIEEYAEFETGKGADALDRRPQLAAALAAARKQNAASLSRSWIGFPVTLRLSRA